MSKFQKIAGYEKQKEALAALVEVFKHRKKYELKGATLPRGIIFYGPPGTGKTLFAEVLAAECSLRKVHISLSDSASENSICRKIRKAFLQGARGGHPTMIFFDELDKLLPNEREEYYTDRSKTILAQLLTLIDGMEKVNNIVFVATCNDYDDLPETITRAGRFDKKIGLGLPDASSREAILHMYINASPAHFEMPAEAITKLTGGFSPAALKTLVNECILCSDDHNFVSEAKIREKILEIKEQDIPSARSEQSYAVDAVRNLGAFVIARAYSGSDYVLSMENGSACNDFLNAIIENAYYAEDEDEDDYDYDTHCECDEEDDVPRAKYTVCSKNDCLAAITALLGGFAAEELIFEKIYDNLYYTLRAADNVILKMSKCGMLGFCAAFNDSWTYYYYSDSFRERFCKTAIQLKEECYEKAKAQVKKNESLIRALLPVLIQRKSIEKEECEVLLAELGGIVS